MKLNRIIPGICITAHFLFATSAYSQRAPQDKEETITIILSGLQMNVAKPGNSNSWELNSLYIV